MNLRSTTPEAAFLAVIKYAAIVFGIAALVLILSFQPTTAKSDEERQSRIDELTKLIDKQTSSTRSLNSQTDSIRSQLSALEKEKAYLESQLKENTRDYELVSKEIASSADSLKSKQAVLGKLMADMYVDGAKSPLELLASSDSVTDFIDQRTYQSVAQDQFQSAMDDVRKSKKKLLAQQKELKALLGNQQNQATALASKQKDQEELFVATEGKSTHLQKITKAMAEEKRQLQTQQQSSIAQMMGGAEQVVSGSISEPVFDAPVEVAPRPPATSKPSAPAPNTNSPSPVAPQAPTPSPTVPKKPTPKPEVVLPNGGYPSYLQNCYVDSNALSYGIDPWGYGCRQCVSYTAWKVLQRTGRPAMYWGNAKQWPASASRVGYRTGTTPKAHSVGVMTSGPYGHVVWVEKVNSNGTINVSQYNYWLGGTSNGGWGWYSEFKNVSPRAYNVYIYF